MSNSLKTVSVTEGGVAGTMHDCAWQLIRYKALVTVSFQLSLLVGASALSMESKGAPLPGLVAETKPAEVTSEERTQDSAFFILIEAFWEIQGRIIQNDYEARIKAANALDDVRIRGHVVELAKEERQLRVTKLSHEVANLDLTYNLACRDDSHTMGGSLPAPIDTGHAAKTLVDYVFIKPAPANKDGAIKTTTSTMRNYLTDKMPDPGE